MFIAGTQNATTKQRYLLASLEIFQQSHVIFEKMLENPDITDSIADVMERFEQRLQSILKNLIKMTIASSGKGSAVVNEYKQMYGRTLRPPGKLEGLKIAEQLKSVLENLM